MGGSPLFALNVAGFPRDRLPLDVLGQIVAGGAAKAAEAGVAVIGGHTIDDPEPKYGLVVIGRVDPARVVRNVGARPGDRLFLTKPLGSGIIATAIKRGLAGLDLIDRVTRLMATLNRAAAEAMATVQPHAATDITGFGLLGHLWEMTSGSGVGAKIALDRVPILSDVWDFAQRDVVPGGTRRNLASLADKVIWGSDLTEIDRLVLTDAQTSGGLLVSVAPDEAAAFYDALVSRGTLAAADIGTIVDGDKIFVDRSS
jgi:selenide,water dikinase